jgi:hypothetical protein
LLAVGSAAAGLSKLVSVQREFDVLNAGLITATGSTEKAAQAFDALTQFAAKTPYDLNQAVEGFTKLVNLGLTPSERALTSYGNTASSMGNSLNDMIEAVADAATGEFERLEEFGIKAKQNGDEVALTFRGTTTTIGNNAAEIEGYLTKLGENQFAGAMAARMDTLDGVISNLGDTWDGLFRKVNEAGVGDVMKDGVKLATAALQELTDMVASGQLEGYIKAIGVQFDGFGADVKQTIQIVSQFIKENFGQWKDEGGSVVDFLIEAFKGIPSNIRALIQLAAVEFASGLDIMKADAIHWRDSVAAIFTSDTIQGAADRYAAAIKTAQTARLGSIDSILFERDTALKASADQVAAADNLRKTYDEANAAKAKAAAGVDALAQYAVGAKAPAAASDGADKTAKAAAKKAESAKKQQEREYASLVDSLQTEEEAINSSYDKRLRIIQKNTQAESAERAAMISRLDSERSDQLEKLAKEKGADLENLRKSLRTEEQIIQESYDARLEIIRANTELGSTLRTDLEAKAQENRQTALGDLEKQKQSERDNLYSGLLTEEELLQQSYDRKKELILASEEVTETERQALLGKLKDGFDKAQAAADTKRIQSQLNNASALFGGMADLAKNFAGEQSDTYKALFAVSKAFAIASALIAMQQNIAEASKAGFPYNIPMIAAAAAQGAINISNVSGVNFSGAHDKGGNIPAGKIGLVGEYGPEFVRGPASVTGREVTDRILNDKTAGQNQQQPQAVPNFKVVNVLDPSIVGDYLDTEHGERLVVNIMNKNRRELGF